MLAEAFREGAQPKAGAREVSESGKLSDVKLPEISEAELSKSQQKQTTKINNFHDKFTSHQAKEVSVEDLPEDV